MPYTYLLITTVIEALASAVYAAHFNRQLVQDITCVGNINRLGFIRSVGLLMGFSVVGKLMSSALTDTIIGVGDSGRLQHPVALGYIHFANVILILLIGPNTLSSSGGGIAS